MGIISYPEFVHELYHLKLKIPHRITVFKTDMISVGKAL